MLLWQRKDVDHVIDGEAQAAKIARFMAAVSLISALAIGLGSRRTT